jgi:Ca2+-binding EF-hand superfamily protein
VVSIAAEPPSWVSLAEIKRITNLQQYTIGEVAECFLSFANNDGMLTRTAFNDVFRELMFTGAHGHAYVCCPAG